MNCFYLFFNFYLISSLLNESCLSDLNKLGGLAVVIRELDNPDTEIRTTSAWILGKASQNNPIVQEQVGRDVSFVTI